MYRKVLIGGAVCAAIVGVGGAALAATGTSSTSSTPSGTSTSSTTAKHHHKGLTGLDRVAHGQFVVKGKDGKYVTEDVVNGDVTSVSSTSISVKAGDGVTETYTVTKNTKIILRTKGQKPAQTDISKAAKGTHVFVLGTGTGTPTATRIVVGLK